MRLLSIILVGFLLFGCKKKKSPKPPASAVLIFPDKNSECNTGTEVNATTTEVEFRWQVAENADTYRLSVSNLNTNTAQTITTTSTSAKLPLQKGAPYSWVVNTKNEEVLETTPSETWLFYNAGFETTYAPFPAEIIEPTIGSTVVKDINNDITLRWEGADVDNDIFGYEVYFSTENPPETLIFEPGRTGTNTKVAVETNTVYYWRVVTKDAEGNTSDSGVYDFRAL